MCEVKCSAWSESEFESEGIGDLGCSSCFALAFSAQNLSLIALTSCLRMGLSWDSLERSDGVVQELELEVETKSYYGLKDGSSPKGENKESKEETGLFVLLDWSS